MIPRTTERPNTIALQWQDSKYEEGRAQGAIYPGMVLEVTTDEPNPQQLPIGVKANTVAGSKAPLRIAMECLLGNPDKTARQGMKISDAYAAGDLVPFIIPRPGDVWQARVAPNTNLHIGALLQTHSDGTLVPVGAGAVVAMVAEEHDFATDNPAITPLLRVQAV